MDPKTAEIFHRLQNSLAVIITEIDITLKNERAGDYYQRTLKRIKKEMYNASKLLKSLGK